MDNFRAFSFDTMVQRLEIGNLVLRISAYPDTGRHISLVLSILMLASLPISRTIKRMQPSGVVIPHGMTPTLQHEIYGTHAPTVPSVSHRGDSMSHLPASLAKPSWQTCDKTRRLPPLHVRPRSSGTGPW